MDDLSILNASELITLNPTQSTRPDTERVGKACDYDYNPGKPRGVNHHDSPRGGDLMEELGILKNASISISDGKITGVGAPRPANKEIDATGKVVMPGFVDPHTHLIFAGLRADEFELRIKGKTYKEIAGLGGGSPRGGIINTVKSTRKTNEEELFNQAMERLNYALEWGTTTLEAKSGYGLFLKDELKILRVIESLNKKHPISIVPTFLGAHAVPPELSKKEYMEVLLNDLIPAVSKYAQKKEWLGRGLRGGEGAPKFCDVFCEAGVFSKEESKKILKRGKEFGLIPKIHADELSQSGGSELAGELGAISADHVVHPGQKGLKLMKEAGTIVVLLPGGCLFLDHKPPVKEILNTGIPIAIGSDFNPGSSPVLSMPIIMSLACLLLKLTPAQAITAATINAAHAIGLGSQIGSLKPGKEADILILNVSSYKEIPYWLGFNPVKTVIKRGKVVISDCMD